MVVRLKKASLRSQSSVNSASARLTEVLEVLGRDAPDTSTPPKSRDFRKVLVLLHMILG
jgi:hypothetical protein